jgi:hypothetical protein
MNSKSREQKVLVEKVNSSELEVWAYADEDGRTKIIIPTKSDDMKNVTERTTQENENLEMPEDLDTDSDMPELEDVTW